MPSRGDSKEQDENQHARNQELTMYHWSASRLTLFIPRNKVSHLTDRRDREKEAGLFRLTGFFQTFAGDATVKKGKKSVRFVIPTPLPRAGPRQARMHTANPRPPMPRFRSCRGRISVWTVGTRRSRQTRRCSSHRNRQVSAETESILGISGPPCPVSGRIEVESLFGRTEHADLGYPVVVPVTRNRAGLRLRPNAYCESPVPHAPSPVVSR